MVYRFKGLFVVFFLMFSFYPTLLYAQFSMPGIENAVSITVSPEHPSPGSSVHLTAQSTILDLSRANITWSSDGKIIATGQGKTDVDVTTGSLGQQTTIKVVADDDSTSATGLATIIPTQIDLLFESNSYTPPFYAGRALPSAGTQLRLQAVPRFIRNDGSLVPAASIIYTWRRNGAVVLAASGLGKFSATLMGPALFSTDTIMIEARTSDNKYFGSTSIRVPSVEPSLILYEDDALFGVLYHRALPSQVSIPAIEMTFVAVPYFAQASGPEDSNLQYEWRVNSKKIPADPVKPGAITLNAASSDGIALVELFLTHVTNFFMGTSGVWNISMKSTDPDGINAAGMSTENPFEQGF